MAGGEDRTPPGVVVIRPREMWTRLDGLSVSLITIQGALTDIQKRLTALERFKWVMLAIGLGGGTGASQIIERLHLM